MDYFSGVREAKEGLDYETLCTDLLSGNTVFLIDGCEKYLAVSAGSDEGRSVEEPSSQTVIKGPKDGFYRKNKQQYFAYQKKNKIQRFKSGILMCGQYNQNNNKPDVHSQNSPR